MFKPKGKKPAKLDKEDIADMKKGTYSAKEEAAEDKKAKKAVKKGGKK